MAKTRKQETATVTISMSIETLMAMMKRIEALEAKCKELESEIQNNFDYAVDHMPTLADNGVKLKVLTDDEPVEVIVQKVA